MKIWACFVCLLFSVTSSAVFAVEMIETPQGIYVRIVPEFEERTTIEGLVDDQIFQPTEERDYANLFFSHEDLCKHVGYYSKVKRLWPKFLGFHPMSQYCRLNDPDKDLVFIFIADTQVNHSEHAKAAAIIKTINATSSDIRFVLSGGDMVDTGEIEQWKTYREVASIGYSSDIPIVPVIGNHEFIYNTDLSFFNKVYSTEGTSTRNYVLDYHHAVLIVLDSNINEMTEEQKTEQLRWLKSTLKQFEGQKTMLVAFHHAVYTSGSGQYTPLPSLRGCVQYITKNWTPLFEQYGVKLVLNGHEHLYERSLVHLNVKEGSEGVHYLAVGPAGGAPWAAMEGSYRNPFAQKIVENTRTVTKIRVSAGGEISITTFGFGDGNFSTPPIIDEYTFR